MREVLAILGALSAAATVAAPDSALATPQAVPPKIRLEITSEIDRRWPELRATIAASHIADIAEPSDWLFTTGDELEDFAELRPDAAGSAAKLGLPLIRLGRLSSGDAQAALAPILMLLWRQKILLALSERPPDRVDACKVYPKDPE